MTVVDTVVVNDVVESLKIWGGKMVPEPCKIAGSTETRIARRLAGSLSGLFQGAGGLLGLLHLAFRLDGFGVFASPHQCASP